MARKIKSLAQNKQDGETWVPHREHRSKRSRNNMYHVHKQKVSKHASFMESVDPSNKQHLKQLKRVYNTSKEYRKIKQRMIYEKG